MKSAQPIGIFDSGVGGLTVWQQIHDLLPDENCIYISDNAHAPYGEKSREELIELSKKNTSFLIAQGVKLIVVACNTATTYAIKELREEYNIPFVGIEPAVKPAAKQTKTGRIAVLATSATLRSPLYKQTIYQYASHIDLIEIEGKGLVKEIESGDLYGSKVEELLGAYLSDLEKENVDQLVLGCTHYPLLVYKIREFVGDKVKLLDPGYAVGLQVKRVLESEGMLRSKGQSRSIQQFYATSGVEMLKRMLGYINGSVDQFKINQLSL